MPLYNFKCNHCHFTFTSLQKFNDPPPVCPHCGSADTEKQVSAPAGLEFKGSGFYATDFKNK